MSAAVGGAVRTGLVLGALGLVVVAHLLGLRVVPVLTGSMTPYAPAGSLVLTAPVRGEAVRVGDVVAFVPPAPFGAGRPVMHRVDGIGTAGSASTTADGVGAGAGGGRSMTTRGDANAHPDPWAVALDGADLGRVVLVVPLLGHLVMAGPTGALLLVGGGLAVVESVRLLRRRPACGCTSVVLSTS